MTQEERAPSRPEVVFAQLLLEIVTGQIKPGASLSSERALSEELSVSRSVVREALKRLEQLGLVQAHHGGSTKINDFRRAAGLDLLSVLAIHAPLHQQATSWWLSIMEMRAALGADSARLCAMRGRPELREHVLSVAHAMARSQDPTQLFTLEVEFWDHVQEGADNIAYRLAFNTMMKVLPVYSAASHQLSLLEVRESGYRVPLATAIANGDPEQAHAEARASLGRTASQLAFALGRAGVAASSAVAAAATPVGPVPTVAAPKRKRA